MRQILRRMEMIHPTIGWRRDEHGTHKHAHGSWILWSVSRVRSKTMHSLSCITSWLPYITLRNNDSRFFLPLEQSRTALLGCSLAIKEKKKNRVACEQSLHFRRAANETSLEGTRERASGEFACATRVTSRDSPKWRAGVQGKNALA